MDKFGVTLRQLRESRGMKASDIYSGIISRTTAFRFEGGKTNISTGKLLEILYRVGIDSFDEFLFFHEQLFDNTSRSLNKLLKQVIHEQGIKIKTTKHKKSLEFYEMYKESKHKEEVFLAYVAHYDYLINQSDLFNQTNYHSQILKDYEKEWDDAARYLLSIETWSFRELDWFSFMSGCFDKELRITLLKSFKKIF
ncbi:helix-turn-helix transcriptional regulator [Lactococcus sp. dk322]|uniref:helix-turn-helix domain-containing protein n=1 Tax=Lactococcus sp. dk322 TaxID=2603290 RepID=UPI0011C967FC|nr:helix-turn-helix transcriptional regulator [Lactococcus sp. dk322]TXK47388.1 helix-turn-helix transcriptional regulator [Lactococcus sp. dk322]